MGEVARKGDQRLLIPNYLKFFSCRAAACEDNCCAAGWTISIDRGTYKKFRDECRRRGTEAGHFQGKFRKTKVTDRPEEDYARVVYQDGRCRMLLPGNLCLIHKEYGENFLPKVCASFPRTFVSLDGVIEGAASFACPPVAETVAGMKHEPIKLIEMPGSSSPAGIWVISRYQSAGYPETDVRRHLLLIREHILMVLQHPAHTLEEKLIMLGLLLRNLDGINGQTDCGGSVFRLVERNQRLLGSDLIREEMSGISSNLGLQLQLLKEIADERILDGAASKQFLSLFFEVMLGLGFVPGNPFVNILEKYAACLTEKATELHRYDYLLEHFLVNHFFGQSLLINLLQPARLFDGFITLTVSFCFLRFLLAGSLAFRGALDNQQATMILRSFWKAVEHSPGYLGRVRQLIAANSLDSMGHMAILIKQG